MGSLGPCGIPESSHGHLRPAAQTSLVWRVLLYPVHGKAALVLSCPCSSPQHTNPPGSWGSSKPRVWLQGLESELASGSFRALQCHSATSASLLFPVWSQYDPSMVPVWSQLHVQGQALRLLVQQRSLPCPARGVPEPRLGHRFPGSARSATAQQREMPAVLLESGDAEDERSGASLM